MKHIIKGVGYCKRMSVIFIIFSLVFMVLVPMSVQADWSATLQRSVSPEKVYIGVETTFTYTLTNTGSASLDITSFKVRFDWQTTSSLDYQLVTSTVGIAPGNEHSFPLVFTPPSSIAGLHSASITITGKAVGDWWARDKDWVTNFEVYEIPPLSLGTSANPTTGTAPLYVGFTSIVSGGLTPYSYSWSFGDGGTSSASNPSHSYSTAGAYTVTVTVSDSSPTTKIETSTITINVETPPPPTSGDSSPPPTSGDDSSGTITYEDTDWTLIIILGLVVLVAIVGIGAAMVKKKAKAPPPQYPQQPPPPPPPTNP